MQYFAIFSYKIRPIVDKNYILVVHLHIEVNQPLAIFASLFWVVYKKHIEKEVNALSVKRFRHLSIPINFLEKGDSEMKKLNVFILGVIVFLVTFAARQIDRGGCGKNDTVDQSILTGRVELIYFDGECLKVKVGQEYVWVRYPNVVLYYSRVENGITAYGYSQELPVGVVNFTGEWKSPISPFGPAYVLQDYNPTPSDVQIEKIWTEFVKIPAVNKNSLLLWDKSPASRLYTMMRYYWLTGWNEETYKLLYRMETVGKTPTGLGMLGFYGPIDDGLYGINTPQPIWLGTFYRPPEEMATWLGTIKCSQPITYPQVRVIRVEPVGQALTPMGLRLKDATVITFDYMGEIYTIMGGRYIAFSYSYDRVDLGDAFLRETENPPMVYYTLEPCR